MIRNSKFEIQNSRPRAGFTLVELLVYVTVSSVALLMMGAMVVNVYTTSLKSRVQREASDTAQVILSRLSHLAGGASTISAQTPTLVTLVRPDASTVTLRLTGTALRVQEGSGASEPLNSTGTTVAGQFTDLSAATRSRNFALQLTIASSAVGFSDASTTLPLVAAYELGAK